MDTKILANKDEIIKKCMMLSEEFSHAEKLQDKINCIELEKEAPFLREKEDLLVNMTICTNGDMVFCFKDGTEIRV